MRQIIPITPACLNFCTRSAPFKVHSLPSGAASFKSLYPKRPANDHATADCSAVGASDTALRLLGSKLPHAGFWTTCRDSTYRNAPNRRDKIDNNLEILFRGLTIIQPMQCALETVSVP